MAVMNLQNDGTLLQFWNQLVQEWVASVSAGAGPLCDFLRTNLAALFWTLSRRFISTAGKPAKVALQ